MANAVGVDGKAGRYEFYGGAEGILSRICRPVSYTHLHTIIPVEDCLLGVKENKTILNKVLSFMKTEGIAAYDETNGKGLVRHVLIRYGFFTKEIMVCLIINAAV